MKDQIEILKGQQVEVIYNGVLYRGRLVGATEDEINLQTGTDWVMLPLEGITTVRQAKSR
ncbi:MAG TPA: hypothetical protein VLY45_07700 [Nitrospiria bacterium]|nr:hypothetical protein [Nitrospiria bacterium]